MERASSTQIDSEPDALITLPAAARRLGIGRRQLKRAVHGGELPLFRIGGWPRVRWRDVLAWIEGRREVEGAE